MQSKLTIAFVLSMLSLTIKAQTSKIELLDLVKILAPDSMAATTTQVWPKSIIKGSTIKWKSTVPKKEGNSFVIRGTAAVVVKGKTITCQGVNDGGGPCKWDVLLSGTKASFSSFTLSADNLHFNDNKIDMIDYFFGKGKLKATLIEKDNEGVLMWYYVYRLQIPGEKDLWMRIQFDSQTATASQAESNDYTDLFNIYFFTTKKEMEAGFF